MQSTFVIISTFYPEQQQFYKQVASYVASKLSTMIDFVSWAIISALFKNGQLI